MKFYLLLLLLLVSSYASAQTGQSGGPPGPSADTELKILTKSELMAVQMDMNIVLNRVKARWVECTYMNQPQIDNFYDLYKSLLYVQVVDNLRSEQFVPGPKKEELKLCNPPLVNPPAENKMNCLIQYSELSFLTYILNSASTYQIFQEVGKVPDEELSQVDSFIADLVNSAPQPAAGK